MEIPNREYIVTISYGNYVGSMGGTDKYIAELQNQLQVSGISVVHLYPLKKKINKKEITTSLMGVLIDGKFIGYYTMTSIVNFIYGKKSSHQLLNIFINHLKDCSIKSICYLLDHVLVPVTFFVHDFYSVCPTGGLIKNDEQFCGADFPNTEKCSECKHFSSSTNRIVEKYKLFLEKYKERMVFLVPSISCGNIWGKAYSTFYNRVLVIPHQNLIGRYTQNMESIQETEPTKIAFIGMPRELKGWKDWLRVCETIGKNSQIRLYHFGGADQNVKNVNHVNVNFNVENQSMVYQLRKERIHCAVLWSKVPETYSYTYYEAFASNCFVVTNSNSGNISDQVEIHKNGYVCSQNEELTGIISDVDRLRELINQFRKKKIYGPDHFQSNFDIVRVLKNSGLDEGIIIKAPRILEFRWIGRIITKLYCLAKGYKREDLFHL